MFFLCNHAKKAAFTPKRKGKRSYLPLLFFAFLAWTECWAVELARKWWNIGIIFSSRGTFWSGEASSTELTRTVTTGTKLFGVKVFFKAKLEVALATYKTTAMSSAFFSAWLLVSLLLKIATKHCACLQDIPTHFVDLNQWLLAPPAKSSSWIAKT